MPNGAAVMLAGPTTAFPVIQLLLQGVQTVLVPLSGWACLRWAQFCLREELHLFLTFNNSAHLSTILGKLSDSQVGGKTLTVKELPHGIKLVVSPNRGACCNLPKRIPILLGHAPMHKSEGTYNGCLANRAPCTSRIVAKRVGAPKRTGGFPLLSVCPLTIAPKCPKQRGR